MELYRYRLGKYPNIECCSSIHYKESSYSTWISMKFLREVQNDQKWFCKPRLTYEHTDCVVPSDMTDWCSWIFRHDCGNMKLENSVISALWIMVRHFKIVFWWISLYIWSKYYMKLFYLYIRHYRYEIIEI